MDDDEEVLGYNDEDIEGTPLLNNDKEVEILTTEETIAEENIINDVDADDTNTQIDLDVTPDNILPVEAKKIY